MRKYGQMALLQTNEPQSALTSATYGNSYIKQLHMLPLPSDPSGKSDTALKYKQINKSQQSDPFRLLFFFFALYNSIFCIPQKYIKSSSRNAMNTDQQLL